jgi:CP family cyanate transporter-like MFS transporter
MVIMVAGSAGRGLSPDTLTLMITSALMGFGVAMMQPSLPALLPRWLETRHLAIGSAIYMNGMLMGEFIGAGLTLPVLMPLMDESWRATLLVWSLPGLLVAAALYLPRREVARPLRKLSWLPDWKNPLTLRLGLLLGLSGSLFFGLNAYMGNLLEQQGNIDLLADALFWYNFAQVAASLVMLKMARNWVGRKLPIIVTAIFSISGMFGTLLFTGWWTIASATFMSFTAGILLILLVALPPMLVESSETGRLSAGNFLIGYTLAFSVPMIGGLLADWGTDARYAVMFILAYCILALPLAFTLDLKRQKGQPQS